MSGHEQRVGDHRVICDFSGFLCWASETVKTWNGNRVHRRLVGEEMNRHPQEFVRAIPDRPGVRDPRPEQADTFISPGDVTPSNL